MYHLSVKAHSRSKGASAPAAAAYRAAEAIRDKRQDIAHDYTGKRGVVATGLLGWEGSRSELWNAAEAAETRKNSCVAREYEIALPAEATDPERFAMVRGFSEWLRERYGVAVDFAIHRPHRTGDQRNHHAHILTTTRTVSDGVFGLKTRILDTAVTGKHEVEIIRKKWGEIIGEDHRSHARRGIDRTPQIHVGKAGTHMQRKGITTYRARLNESIKDGNAELAALDEQLAVIAAAQRRIRRARIAAQVETVETENERYRRILSVLDKPDQLRRLPMEDLEWFTRGVDSGRFTKSAQRAFRGPQKDPRGPSV